MGYNGAMGDSLRDFTVRGIGAADLADALRLTRAAGWNQTAADWQLMFDHSPDGCFGAVVDDADCRGRVVGSVVAMGYGQPIGWIGMMLVDPDYRRRGIARALMNSAIEHLQDHQGIWLDATPAGRAVYEQLGFVATQALTRWTCDACNVTGADNASAQPIASADIEQVAQLDQQAFGADRRRVLISLIERWPNGAWRLGEGFVIGRPGEHCHQIGPLLASSLDEATALFAQAAKPLRGRAVVVDVPDDQLAFGQWLNEHGFVAQRPFTRMVRGQAVTGPLAGRTCAIMGPEFG